MTVIDVAKKEIGYSEIPANSNKTKYGKWFGFDGVAWCGIFCSWVYHQAGTPLPKIGFTKGFAGCQTAVAYFKKMNWITDKPVQGDLVFFDWNSDGRYDHVGIYDAKVTSTKFLTVEGNTSVSNDSNGGTVMARTRDIKVALFVHIPQ